jgi:hypothetical protein
MDAKYRAEEARIEQALIEYNDSSELKLTDLSKKYDVDYNKLYRRSKGRPGYGQPG